MRHAEAQAASCHLGLVRFGKSSMGVECLVTERFCSVNLLLPQSLPTHALLGSLAHGMESLTSLSDHGGLTLWPRVADAAESQRSGQSVST